MSPNIEKLIEDAKLALVQILDEDMPEQAIAQVLDNLKIELVSGIVEEEGVQAKNQYEVVYLKVNSSKIELQEDDIPIGYQAYRSMFSSGSSSGTGAGGQEIVREIIVLRPVVEEKS